MCTDNSPILPNYYTMFEWSYKNSYSCTCCRYYMFPRFLQFHWYAAHFTKFLCVSRQCPRTRRRSTSPEARVRTFSYCYIRHCLVNPYFLVIRKWQNLLEVLFKQRHLLVSCIVGGKVLLLGHNRSWHSVLGCGFIDLFLSFFFF
jgi:hypothetical protein